MEERFVPAAAAEARPVDAAGATPGPDRRPAIALDDPRALQILTTEHWGLLTARSLVYNEAFARAGMFLAFLSATLLVLGLISTATGFSDGFLVVAAIVLGLDLFVGLASLGRISSASNEDIRYLQGMNRLRHAYQEIVPGLEDYFITSAHDDFDSVAMFYGPSDENAGLFHGVVHGLTTTPGMIGVICAAVAGGLSAVLVLLATHDPLAAGLAALAGFLLLFLTVTAVAVRVIAGFQSSLDVRFPRPGGARRGALALGKPRAGSIPRRPSGELELDADGALRAVRDGAAVDGPAREPLEGRSIDGTRGERDDHP
jgi:hypothetical protein